MKLVIAEKPSVAQSLATVIGSTARKDGYLEGNGWRVSWCVGHLAGLADADSYDPKYAKSLAQGGQIGWGLRLVDGLNIGAVAGVPIAIAAYFWANRLLPVGLAERPQAEISWFFIAWGAATLAGLAWPTKRMWQVQLGLGGALFAGVPLLNGATTATHLGATVPLHLWVVAGFDLTCLALGLFLLACAGWLYRRKSAAATRRTALGSIKTKVSLGAAQT